MDIVYTPPQTVEAFIQHFLPNQLFYAFIVGPYGSGKTTGALFKIPYMASQQAKNPKDGVRRSRVVVVRNTLAQLRDTTLSSWNYWFKDGEAGKWHATKNTFVLKFNDVECEVLFRALDTPDDISRVLSLEITHAILDEFVQIPKEIVEALSGRVGRYPPRIAGGATHFGMWGASNPGEMDTFWHDLLVNDKPRNVEYFHQPSGLSPQAENKENLPQGYYENLAVGKSHSWIKQYIDAEWGYSIAGQPVIPTFSRQLHVSPVPLRPDEHLTLVIGYDPGLAGSALIFGQMDFYGQLRILDEICLESTGAERMIKDRLLPLIASKYRGFEVVIAPDPAANNRSQTNETTIVQILKQERYRKFWTVKVDDTNLLQPRIDAIDHFATRLTQRGPALLIDPSCRRLIRALSSGWRFEKTIKGVEKAMPEKNEWSHPGDACGYLCRYFVKNDQSFGVRSRKSNQSVILPIFNNPYTVR